MPYKKKAPAKRTKKAVGGALSAVQKRTLGQVQKEMVNRGAGAITKEVVGMTRKYGDQRKSATVAAPKRKAPSKASKNQMARAAIARGVPKATGKKIVAVPKRGPKRGGIAMSKAARANLMRMQREAFKTGKSNPRLAALTKKHGMLVKRGDAQKQMQSQRGSTSRRRMPTAAQLAAAKRRGSLTLAQKRAQMAAAKRRGSSTTSRLTTGSLKQRITSRSGTVAQRRARALAARRRAAAAARRGRPAKRGPISRIPRQPGTRGRMTPAQRRARLLAARRRLAAMKRRAPTRRPNTRSQNLTARRAASTRRRSRAGVGRRIGAPTSRRGRPSTTTRQRRFIGGLIAGIRKATKRKNSSPMRAMLTGVKTKSAGGSALRNKLTGSRLKKRGILGKTRTAVGKKLAAGSKVSKSTYKGRGFFGAIKAKKKSTGTGIRGITYWNSKGKNKVTSRPGGIFGRMGRPSRPASGGMRRVGGRLVMGKAMTAPKRMIKSPTRPTIIKVPKTKYGKNTGTDPYKKAMNKAMKM